MSTSLLPLLFASCPSPPPRPRAVLLAYTWGSGPSSCSPYFIRSWVALPPSERANTDLRILWEGSVAPCAGEPVGADAQFIKMPDDVLKTLKATKLNPAAYRMRAFTWWLALPEAKARNYGYVGVLDTDMIFQSDLFDALHAYTTEHGIQQEEVLHLVSENPAERNGLYTARRLHLDSRCDVPLTDFLMNNHIVSKTPAVGGAGRRLRGAAKAPVYTPLYNTTAFWGRFGDTHRLNFGSMFGTHAAMVALCEQVVDVLVGPMAFCWDQGMLNILVWTNLLTFGPRGAPPKVYVWDCFEGPVKTLDVGGLRDEKGRFYNERGALYPLVHQFRATRQSKFVKALAHVFPQREPSAGRAGERLHYQQYDSCPVGGG